jgi:flagellin-like hook-associated protein FlgL
MISINVNPAASGASLNLGRANDALQKSLARLSSGQRIVNSSDDAGGLAVSMKMSASLRRTEATAVNLRNIVSYLDTQDGAFKVADKVMSRMSELTNLARDVTKNPGDVENYDKEFGNLKAQMLSLATEKFNGVGLFYNGSVSGKTITVPTSEDGSQDTSVTQAAVNSDPMLNMMSNGFKKFGIQGSTFYAEKINDAAQIYPDGPTSSATVKNIYTMPNGDAHTLSINADPITEPVTPTTTVQTAGASSFTYAFGLNYDLDAVKRTENLNLIYPANMTKAVDDISKPIYAGTPAKAVNDAYGYPTYMPLDDIARPIPNTSSATAVSTSPANIVGSINTTSGAITYTTPNTYAPGQPIGFYQNGNTSSVVYYNIKNEVYTISTGTVSQQQYEDVKGVPPFIWREVKVASGADNPVGSMRWFNTSTGQYTRSLPSGGSSPGVSGGLGHAGSSLPGFGFDLAFTPPQYSATNPNQEIDQGNVWVNRLLSARINGVANSNNLNNNSTHNTNLVYDNSRECKDSSVKVRTRHWTAALATDGA